jgi:hypothetical protein
LDSEIHTVLCDSVRAAAAAVAVVAVVVVVVPCRAVGLLACRVDGSGE